MMLPHLAAQLYGVPLLIHRPKLDVIPVSYTHLDVYKRQALIGVPTAVDVTTQGKRLRRGIKVFAVTTGIAKMELYNHLRQAADVAEDGITAVFPAGFVHASDPRIFGEEAQNTPCLLYTSRCV